MIPPGRVDVIPPTTHEEPEESTNSVAIMITVMLERLPATRIEEVSLIGDFGSVRS